jgi:putative Holliday junction resolvase
MIIYSVIHIKKFLKDKGRILALDVGTKRIGIAISDDTRSFSSPKAIIKRHSNKIDFDKIKKIINEHNIIILVIGLPLNMDGSCSLMSKFIKNFAYNLDQFLQNKIPITLFDERLSSFAAQENNLSKLSRKKDYDDDIAASIILEEFLVEINLKD